MKSCTIVFLLATASVQATLAGTPYDVVVTTTMENETKDGTNASATVITKKQIEQQKARRLSEVLRQVPGLDIVQTGSPGHTTSIFMRGADSNQFLIMIDGIPVDNPYFGGYDIAELSTEFIDRIEIVRGPFSALYGSDAIGGVINIISTRGTSGFHADAAVEGGSDSYRRAQAAVHGGGDAFDYHLSGSFRDGNGQFQNDDFTNKTAFATLGWHPGDGMRLGFEARYKDSDLGIPFNGTASSPWRRYTTTEKIYALPFSHEVSNTFGYEVRLSRVDADYFFDDLGSAFPYADTTETTSDRLDLTFHYQAGANRLSAGLGVERIDVTDRDNFGTNLSGAPNDSNGIFLQDSASFGALSFTAGIRYDDYDSFGSSVSPRLSVAYDIGDGSSGARFRAAYGEAFRAPTSGELFFPFSGNGSLEAEESRSVEAGVAYHGLDGKLHTGLTWFDTKVRNLIDFEFSTSTFQNIGRSRMRGFEFSLDTDLQAGFSLAASYTKLKATDETTGERLLRRPDNRASLILNYRGIEDKWNANAKLFWVDERPDVDPDLFTDITTPGYTRADLAASYLVTPRLEPYIRIENALDRAYEEAAGFPAPGRTFVGGIRFKID